jgi:hypothetical protein
MSVAYEDMVLYTAQAYTDCKSAGPLRSAALDRLSQVVRCPQLSLYWLHAVACSPDTRGLLPARYAASMRRLLQVRLFDPQADGSTIDMAFLCDEWQPAPAPAWSLQRRATAAVPGGGVRLTWALPLSKLQDACGRCKETQAAVVLTSPNVTAPLGGLAWELVLKAAWEAGGVLVGVFVEPTFRPAGCLHIFEACITCGGAQ